MQIFGVIPFIRTTFKQIKGEKRGKMWWRANPLIFFSWALLTWTDHIAQPKNKKERKKNNTQKKNQLSVSFFIVFHRLIQLNQKKISGLALHLCIIQIV